MKIALREWSSGAFHGAAAWSAYAVVEFAASSVLFRLTRPYAVFTPWHWRLTALLIVGYIVTGGLLGAFASWCFRSSRKEIAALTVVAALAVNATLAQLGDMGGAMLAASLLFAGLLLAGLFSDTWRKRLGGLTNSWVISGLWLGVGLEFGLQSAVALQLGARLTLAAWGLAAALVLAAVAAVVLGRMTDSRPSLSAFAGALPAMSCGAAIALLAICVFLPTAGSYRAQAAVSQDFSVIRPNLILIVMDTVRADHLSLYGYPLDTTPNLRALAQDAAVYPNAMSASDITLTSHASLFTGMYPSWHGAYCQPPEAAYGRELAARVPTLAELLKRGGYETLGAAANLYLRSDFGLERGFDQFRIPRPVPLLMDESRYMLRRGMRRLLSLAFDTAQFDRLYAFGEDINSELFAALESRARPTAPFFAFVNYMDAHYPYVPPAPFNDRFSGKRPRITQDDLEREQDLIARGKSEPAGYRPHCESQYDGGIAYIDRQIGGITAWLKRHNAYENTMIVVTSDHGESFGERRRVGHANSPYQNLLHTGLLIKYPRTAHREIVTTPASLTDVAPTVLAALGLPVPAAMQGVDLAAARPRPIYAETFVCPVMHSPDCPDGCIAKTIVEWPLKFIATGNGARELFDLAADPTEQRNLFIREPAKAAALRANLADWAKTLPAQTRQTKQLDPRTRAQLEGLGYIAR